MNFTNDQQKAIDARGKDTLLSASAGSGKTRVLVERLCQLILKDRISVDQILAMTFTNDAAAEMRDRLRARLLEEKSNDFIHDQLALLENADICTIDSFCFKLVKNYYYKIPITLYRANTIASEAQKKEAFDQGFQKALKIVNSTNLRRYLTLLNQDISSIQKTVENCINNAWAKPDPEAYIKAIQASQMDDEIQKWFVTYFQEQVLRLIEICQQGENIDPIFIEKKALLKKCLNQDYTNFYYAFKTYIENCAYMRAGKQTEDKEQFKVLKEKIKAIEIAIAELLYPVETYLSDEKENEVVRNEFCDLVLETKKQFDQIKDEMEILDFNDIELYAYQLLKNEMIRLEIHNQYKAILIDEFQDTNELQESIIKQFAQKGIVFRVGDIKQSIYGFRQANPSIMKNHMNEKDECTLYMDKNFRSNANIIQFNNDFYQKIMNSDCLGTNFTNEDIANVGVDAQRNCEQVPIRFLYSEADSWAKENEINVNTARSKFNKNCMDIIAHDILEKHKNGTPFRDICILTRNRTKYSDYNNILEAYGIPASGDSKGGYYSDSAVQIILSCLQALINPMDDIALTAALCSPIGQVEINQLITEEKSGPLYFRIKDKDFMLTWHQLEKEITSNPSQCLQTLYAWNNFYFDYTTAQNKTNLDDLLIKSTSYDYLVDFVAALNKDAKEDALSETNPYDIHADIVQLKTMHESKGLQFPVVYILSDHESKKDTNYTHIYLDADLGVCTSSFSKNGHLVRKSMSEIAFKTKQLHDDLNEEMRIFYVATTRAEKELIFVDSINSVEDYQSPLNTNALLENKKYTSWLFHTYFNDPQSPVHFVKVGLYERPNQQEYQSHKKERSLYQKKATLFESKTASQSKMHFEWKEFSLDGNKNTTRGTLFHEIMAQCSYPYQKEEIENFASKSNYSLTTKDLEQVQAINTNPIYAQWMKEKHEFECSYILQEKQEVIHGFMDLVIWEEDTIHILDFKTDGLNQDELIKAYKSQLDTYAQAMHKINPDKQIQTWIYSFHLNQLFKI